MSFQFINEILKYIFFYKQQMDAQIQNLRYKDKTQLIEYLEGMVRDYRKETDQNKQRIIKLEMEIFFKELDIIDFEKTESKVQKLLNEN